jgi:threonine aldolase
VALGVSARELARGFDSVMFCLSKGLGAPVGSLLCGGRGFIAEARRARKRFGGGMRQAGVLAAAGLLALREGPGRLAADHANAAWLACQLQAVASVELDPESVQTNLVVFRARGGSARWLAAAARAGVLGFAIDAESVRLTTHRDVSPEQIREAARRLAGLPRV